jgi:hypothetical protein
MGVIDGDIPSICSKNVKKGYFFTLNRKTFPYLTRNEHISEFNRKMSVYFPTPVYSFSRQDFSDSSKGNIRITKTAYGEKVDSLRHLILWRKINFLNSYSPKEEMFYEK